jgi:moderate conductance mechanosensitive channel
MDFLDFGDFDPDLIKVWIATTGIQILIIVVLSVIAYWLLLVVSRHLSNRIKNLDDEEGSALDKRTETISRLIRSAGLVIILITALLMILDQLGIAIGPILASVGLLSLAIGLGAQTLVKDVIGGIFIVMEDQYHIDEVIEFDGRIGTVEDITLRITKVRDFKGYLHIVPNGDIRLVTNRTRGWSRAVLDVGITYETDLEQALKALEEIGQVAKNDPEVGPLLLEEPQVTGVEDLEDWQIRLRLIVKTEPNEHWAVQRYLRRLVREQFPEKGLTIAFPRQEVVVLGLGNQVSDGAIEDRIDSSS